MQVLTLCPLSRFGALARGNLFGQLESGTGQFRRALLELPLELLQLFVHGFLMVDGGRGPSSIRLWNA
ncbi:MAG TPA: hypothetical protein VGX03_02420 [Candidatus Binatia bacterium]|nr:hypothetical protein [Candidatus Binatia bacterium]